MPGLPEAQRQRLFLGGALAGEPNIVWGQVEMRRGLVAFMLGVAGAFLAAWLGRVGQRTDQYWLEIVGAAIAVICAALFLMSAFWLSKGLFRLLMSLIGPR